MGNPTWHLSWHSLVLFGDVIQHGLHNFCNQNSMTTMVSRVQNSALFLHLLRIMDYIQPWILTGWNHVYFTALPPIYVPTRQLCSLDHGLLVVPLIRSARMIVSHSSFLYCWIFAMDRLPGEWGWKKPQPSICFRGSEKQGSFIVPLVAHEWRLSLASFYPLPAREIYCIYFYLLLAKF